MEFTHEQISEIISEITNGEQGLQGLGKQGFESLMLSERSLHNCSHQDVSNGYRDRRVCHEAQTLSHHSTLDDHNNRRQINNEINLELFCRYLFVFGDRNWRTWSLLSVVWLFLSLTGGTPHYVRQTSPVGRSEKVRRHSPELQWSPIPITSD